MRDLAFDEISRLSEGVRIAGNPARSHAIPGFRPRGTAAAEGDGIHGLDAHNQE
jgi:hypothetical protein